jgi:hypothetical protein
MHLMKSNELEKFVVLTAMELSFVSMWNGQRNLFPQAKTVGIDVGLNHVNSNTVGHTEINAWGQNDLYSLVVTSTGKLTD